MSQDPVNARIAQLNAERAAMARQLLDEIRAADTRMDQLRGQMALVSQWRQQKIASLRQLVPVSEIAVNLGVTRQAIYAAGHDLNEDERAAHPFWKLNLEGDIPDREELQDVIERLAVDAKLAQNIANGSAAPVQINEASSQMLAEDLNAALVVIAALAVAAGIVGLIGASK